MSDDYEMILREIQRVVNTEGDAKWGIENLPGVVRKLYSERKVMHNLNREHERAFVKVHKDLCDARTDVLNLQAANRHSDDVAYWKNIVLEVSRMFWEKDHLRHNHDDLPRYVGAALDKIRLMQRDSQ